MPAASDSPEERTGPLELGREEAARQRKRLLDHQAAAAKKATGEEGTQTDSEDTTLANFILPGD